MKMAARIPRNQAMNPVEDKNKRKEAISLFGRKDLIPSPLSDRKMSEAETESRESEDENMELPKDSKYEMKDSSSNLSSEARGHELKQQKTKKSSKADKSDSSSSSQQQDAALKKQDTYSIKGKKEKSMKKSHVSSSSS